MSVYRGTLWCVWVTVNCLGTAWVHPEFFILGRGGLCIICVYFWTLCYKNYVSSITVTWGTWRAGSFTGDFKGQQKRTLETERLSVSGLCGGNLEGGLLYWGLWRIYKEGCGNGRLSPYGSLWGTRRGLFFAGEFESKVRFWFTRRPCLLGNPREIKKKK
jgi:hypothetical protein